MKLIVKVWNCAYRDGALGLITDRIVIGQGTFYLMDAVKMPHKKEGSREKERKMLRLVRMDKENSRLTRISLEES